MARCWLPAAPARADSTIFRARCTPPRCGTRRIATWTELAANRVDRGYHSVSLLLPDGTVLHGAGGDANDPGTGREYPRQTNHEIFRPPYLFRGARPTVTSLSKTSLSLQRDVHRDHTVCSADNRRALDSAGGGYPRVRREPAGEHVEVHPGSRECPGDHAGRRAARASRVLPVVSAQPKRCAVGGKNCSRGLKIFWPQINADATT